MWCWAGRTDTNNRSVDSIFEFKPPARGLGWTCLPSCLPSRRTSDPLLSGNALSYVEGFNARAFSFGNATSWIWKRYDIFAFFLRNESWKKSRCFFFYSQFVHLNYMHLRDDHIIKRQSIIKMYNNNENIITMYYKKTKFWVLIKDRLNFAIDKLILELEFILLFRFKESMTSNSRLHMLGESNVPSSKFLCNTEGVNWNEGIILYCRTKFILIFQPTLILFSSQFHFYVRKTFHREYYPKHFND